MEESETGLDPPEDACPSAVAAGTPSPDRGEEHGGRPRVMPGRDGPPGVTRMPGPIERSRAAWKIAPPSIRPFAQPEPRIDLDPLGASGARPTSEIAWNPHAPGLSRTAISEASR